MNWRVFRLCGSESPWGNMPLSPCIELGWHLLKKYWGFGYATETAKRTLNYAFDILELDEVVAFTTLKNKPSLAIMDQLGMTCIGDTFIHPDIDLSSAVCEHVLYKITNNQWYK